MSEFFSERYKNVSPYVPGEQPQNRKFIKLNTNENPFPPSPTAVAAVGKEVLDRLRLYSDPEADYCATALAEYYGLERGEVLLTNGSDEALAFVFAAFCDDKRGIVAPEISYGFYPVFAELLCIKYDFIPLKCDYKVDVDAFCGLNKNIVIANPNAPTGIAVTVDEVERIVKSNSGNVVIIDEAYMDFGNQSAVKLLEKYRNLIIVGTFSKSRSLAGGRLGYILADKDIIADVKKVKYSFNPYNVNRLTDLMGKYAVEDVAYFNSCVKTVVDTRKYSSERFRELGFSVLPSSANFLFVKKDGVCGKDLYLRLKERGILVRHFDNEKITDFLRVSIGKKEDMDILFKVLKEIL